MWDKMCFKVISSITGTHWLLQVLQVLSVCFRDGCDHRTITAAELIAVTELNFHRFFSVKRIFHLSVWLISWFTNSIDDDLTASMPFFSWPEEAGRWPKCWEVTRLHFWSELQWLHVFLISKWLTFNVATCRRVLLLPRGFHLITFSHFMRQ